MVLVQANGRDSPQECPFYRQRNIEDQFRRPIPELLEIISEIDLERRCQCCLAQILIPPVNSGPNMTEQRPDWSRVLHSRRIRIPSHGEWRFRISEQDTSANVFFSVFGVVYGLTRRAQTIHRLVASFRARHVGGCIRNESSARHARAADVEG